MLSYTYSCKCNVPGCNYVRYKYQQNEKRALFHFPINKVRALQWINQIGGLKAKNLKPTWRVCERHFEEKFLIKEKINSNEKRKWPKLSSDAFPTINLMNDFSTICDKKSKSSTTQVSGLKNSEGDKLKTNSVVNSNPRSKKTPQIFIKPIKQSTFVPKLLSHKCVVPHCGYVQPTLASLQRSGSTQKRSLFRFPQDEVRTKQWIHRIPARNFTSVSGEISSRD